MLASSGGGLVSDNATCKLETSVTAFKRYGFLCTFTKSAPAKIIAALI